MTVGIVVKLQSYKHEYATLYFYMCNYGKIYYHKIKGKFFLVTYIYGLETRLNIIGLDGIISEVQVLINL